MKKIGSYLKEKRIESGVTQKQLADMFGLSSAQYISNVERGRCEPSLLKIDLWCEAVGADPSTVLKCMVSEYKESVCNSLGMKP